MEYTKGQRFQLNTHVGAFADIGGVHTLEKHPDAGYEAFRDRHHPLFEGQVGTVVEVVPAEMDGAGNNKEEHVILALDYHDPETQQPIAGRTVAEGVPRHVSFTQKQMDEWFVPVAVGAIEAAMQQGV